jgi:hypothetical protein
MSNMDADYWYWMESTRFTIYKVNTPGKDEIRNEQHNNNNNNNNGYLFNINRYINDIVDQHYHTYFLLVTFLFDSYFLSLCVCVCVNKL